MLRCSGSILMYRYKQGTQQESATAFPGEDCSSELVIGSEGEVMGGLSWALLEFLNTQLGFTGAPEIPAGLYWCS